MLPSTGRVHAAIDEDAAITASLRGYTHEETVAEADAVHADRYFGS
jgi:hypothetical protein